MARREVPELVTQTAHNTVIRNPNQSLNNNVFSFSSQHQPPRRCGATSIDGDGKGAPAVDSGAVELVNASAAKGQEEMAVPAMRMNATTNATQGSPPASAVAAAAVANGAIQGASAIATLAMMENFGIIVKSCYFLSNLAKVFFFNQKLIYLQHLNNLD